MIANKETFVTKDRANKKIQVVRDFDAPREKVWRAWTEPGLLDQWWAPRPWKAVTVSMDFRSGGKWFYYMEGPDGARHYCSIDYTTIEMQRSFEGVDAFCDDRGNINEEFPKMNWKVVFSNKETGTTVSVDISFEKETDLDKILEMGFQEGFTAALGNLDELLEK